MIACRERFTVFGACPKWTYVTRIMPTAAAAGATIGPHDGPARAGDLVVARVGRLGIHGHVEDPHGRRVRLYPGDLVAGAYGNRYATDFYEGYVPAGARTHLLTAGGLIGTVAAAHNAHADPTTLEVVGRLVDGQLRPLSLEDYARPLSPAEPARAPITGPGSPRARARSPGPAAARTAGTTRTPGPARCWTSWTSGCRPPSAIRWIAWAPR
jgi:hypothetical protein